MAIKVQSDFVERFKILDFEYPFVEDCVASCIPDSGILLPRKAGFPAKYEIPRVSFKIYKAISQVGLQHLADSILRTKKRSMLTPNYIWDSIGKFSKRSVNGRVRELSAYKQALERLRD